MTVAITLVQGDITEQRADAVVNAANSSQYGKGLATGQAVATTAGRLAAEHVIHTVGPVWSAAEDRSELLASCHREALRVAAELGARTVAFPAISTGIYRWPLDDAARIAVRTVREAADPALFDEVRFVLFGKDAHDAFAAAVAEEG